MSAPRVIVFTNFVPPSALLHKKEGVLSGVQMHAEVVKFFRGFVAYGGNESRTRTLLFARPVASVAPALKRLNQHLYKR